MSQPALFGIYTARFPFLDKAANKIRPVIVISKPYGRHNTIVVIPVSSTTKPEPVDIGLDKWRAAGLVKPSVARVHRMTTLLQSDLATQLGVLSTADVQQLNQSLRTLLNL